ncbi:MAG: hypothetical protein II843_01340 [Alphaproteobacteria bacterium]|nr:hypothetical protein [Alphaproteobacteria bacterium]
MPCILKDDIKKLRQAINEKGGMAALRDMTAQERVNFFAEYVDMPKHTETAEWLNRQIEQRVLVPGQIQATKEWLKKLEKKGRPIKQKKAIIDRIENKKEVMSPKASRRYMEGMAKQVMGFEISRDDAKTLFDLSTTINKLKKNLLREKPNYFDLTSEQLQKLDGEALKIRQELANKLVEFQKTYEAISLKAQDAVIQSKSKAGKAGEKVLKVAGNIKSLKASVDFSFLRQLQNTAYVDFNSFKDAMKAGYRAWFESEQGVDTMLGDLLTRPNALSGRYNDFGIEVGIKEEAFPESWVSQKIGDSKLNVFRRSEASFNLAIQTARANLFDFMWEQSKGDVKLLKTENVGAAINTITGRGKIPLLTSKDEKQNRIINNLLFAPKWLASRIETLLDLRLVLKGKGLGTTPTDIRARAAVGNAIMLGVIIPLLKAIGWGTDSDDERDFWEFLEQTFEPRSTDFGKIRIGTTRFDLTTGTGGLLTLFSRVATGETVTLAGVKRDTKRGDVIWNFAKGKGAPALHTVAELATNTDYFGKDLKWNTAGEVAKNIMEFVAPISVSSIYKTSRDIYLDKVSGESAFGETVGVLADFVGISANTYDTADKDLGKSDKALQVEKRVAWATNKQPISAKLASNTVVMRDAPSEDIAQERQLEFANKLSVAENNLINSPKFKNADMETRDEMLKEMRKKVYANFKKGIVPPKPKKRLKKQSKNDNLK